MTPPCGVLSPSTTRLPSAICMGAFSHRLDVEKHPRAVRVFADRTHQQIRNRYCQRRLWMSRSRTHVMAPASLPRHADGIERRFAGPVPIGVLVEAGLHKRLQAVA